MDNKHRELFIVKQSKRCQVYAENAAKCAWRPGSAQTRWGSLSASPEPIGGLLLRRREGRWEEKQETVGKDDLHLTLF